MSQPVQVTQVKCPDSANLAQYMLQRVATTLKGRMASRKGIWSSESMPEALQRRVVGATSHRHGPRGWEYLTRYEQVSRNVERHRHVRWLAIDDNGTDWAEEYRANLVLTDSLLGLGAASAQAELREKLELLHR